VIPRGPSGWRCSRVTRGPAACLGRDRLRPGKADRPGPPAGRRLPPCDGQAAAGDQQRDCRIRRHAPARARAGAPLGRRGGLRRDRPRSRQQAHPDQGAHHLRRGQGRAARGPAQARPRLGQCRAGAHGRELRALRDLRGGSGRSRGVRGADGEPSRKAWGVVGRPLQDHRPAPLGSRRWPRPRGVGQPVRLDRRCWPSTTFSVRRAVWPAR